MNFSHGANFFCAVVFFITAGEEVGKEKSDFLPYITFGIVSLVAGIYG